MKTLSGLDATFLYLETAETPMHVGSLHLYELPAGFKGSFHAAVRKHLAQRVHLAPIFHQRLAFMPLDLGHPSWVNAEPVDLAFHIRKVAGGARTVREVQAEAARLHGERIDRAHPLWEFYIFDSVKAPSGGDYQGKLVAFYSKIHHAALDGKAGTLLANAILDVTPVPREVPPPAPTRNRRRQADLKLGEMIGAVFSNSLAQYAKLVKALPGAASKLGGAVAHLAMPEPDGKRAPGTGPARRVPKAPLRLAPHTVFNAAITPQRTLATASLPFAQCKRMGQAMGGSFNDIVLWLCATALRNYLIAHQSLPAKPLVAAMPVSLREAGNTELTTQASMTLVDLATQVADPLKRMQAILASTAKVKAALVELKSVLPTDYPSLLAPWLVGGVAKAAFKTYGVSGVAEHLPLLANVVISNVPGPQVPLYLAGARMRTFHPMSIVMHGLALNITVQTYAGSVDFGLIADARAVPDVQALADGLLAAFHEAEALYARFSAPTAPPPGQTPSPRVAKATKKRSTPSKAGAIPAKTRRKAATVPPIATARKKAARA